MSHVFGPPSNLVHRSLLGQRLSSNDKSVSLCSWDYCSVYGKESKESLVPRVWFTFSIDAGNLLTAFIRSNFQWHRHVGL